VGREGTVSRPSVFPGSGRGPAVLWKPGWKPAIISVPIKILLGGRAFATGCLHEFNKTLIDS
jgi:hypothetical protein